MIPRSPLANRFSKCVPGLQNWYPGIYNSKGKAFIARFNKLDIRYNSLSMALDRQYAFDDAINYNVSDDIVKFSNQLLYAWTICPTIDLYNCETLVTKQLLVWILIVLPLNFVHRGYLIPWETFWLLSNFVQRVSINRTALFTFSRWEKMQFVRQTQTIRVTNFDDRLMIEKKIRKHVTDFYTRYHLRSIKLRQDKHVDKLVGKSTRRMRERTYIRNRFKYRYFKNLLQW